MRVPPTIKVVFVHPNNKLTGQEFSLLERMVGLRRLGQVACTLLLPEKGEFGDLVEREDFPVKYMLMHRLKKRNPIPFIKTVWAMRKLLRSEEYHLVHCSGIYPNQFCLPAAALCSIPLIAQVTTTVYNDYDITSNFVSKVDLLITCSMAAKNHLENMPDLTVSLKPENILCVYDGIAENTQMFTEKDNERLREEFGFDENDKVIGQLSEMIPRKGCEDFVEMARLVKQSVSKSKFLIIGKCHNDEYEQRIRDQITKYNLEKDVILTGFRKDFYALLNLCDVSVLASLAEGLGRVIVETQYMAKPIVATAVSGNVEAIEDGKSGYLVSPQDPEALASKVVMLLSDRELCKRLGASGFLSAKHKFSLDAHAMKLKDIYINILKQR